MRPGNIFSGAAFKAAMLSIVVFAVVLVATGAVVVQTARTSMIGELTAQIGEEVLLFKRIYRNEGPAALIDAIDNLARTHVSGQRLVGAFSQTGERLAGDATLAPDFLGWGVVGRNQGVVVDTERFHANVFSIEDRLFVVGRNLTIVERAQNTLVRALLLAGIAVTVVSLAIGYIISRNVFGKLDGMAATLDQVSRGDTRVRLPVSARNDQIDRISTRINEHLDRLSALFDSTRNTIVSVAHDLRTPLNRAYLLVQSASDDTRGADERADALANAIAEIEGITGTFDTILRIARISASDDREGFTALSPGALVAELAETYGPVLEEAGQSLVVDHTETEARIVGDRRMLWQMLVNLVENASRHTPAGTEVRLAVRTQPGATILEVADDGPGIPEADLAEALKPFRQIGVPRDLGGAGLGLALVRAIADRHAAQIDLVDNAPGLRVTIRFPSVDAWAPDMPKPVRRSE